MVERVFGFDFEWVGTALAQGQYMFLSLSLAIITYMSLDGAYALPKC